MAHFYGTIQGNRGQVSRLGSKESGFSAYAASWSGAVQISLYERNGVDYARVSLTQHYNGAGSNRVIYDGPISGKVTNEAA
jgi:hypothetical protein